VANCATAAILPKGWKEFMPDRAFGPFFLLSCFAEFYEVVADIKLAVREGRLPTMLRVGDLPAPTGSADIAAMISGQLAGVIRRQSSRVNRECSPGAVRAYRIAAYAMAALADEIFVLELDWAGHDAWLDVLVEYKLFKSRTAGSQLFSVTQKLLDMPVRNALHLDLASVLLMTLQLGFKGQHRGVHGETTLRDLRTRLFAVLRTGDAGEHLRVAFPQAYQNLAGASVPVRLAPLTPWYVAGGIALLLYLVVSTLVWLHLTQPFLDAISGG
jgi:type VI secretion system protein ImpK